MLQAILESPFGSENRPCKAEWFEFVQDAFVSATGETLAIHRDSMWQFGNATFYTAIQFDADVVLQFTPAHRVEPIELGPLSRLRVVGSSMWHVTQRHELLARLAVDGWDFLDGKHSGVTHCRIVRAAAHEKGFHLP
jgi:hypothetical protein